MYRNQNNRMSSILILVLSLGIAFVIYSFVTKGFSGSTYTTEDYDSSDSITEVSYTEDEVEEEVADESSQIVGSWKYYIFPENCDATQYITFRSDGSFEMYENPGAAYATHCMGKESGTYTFDGTNLTLYYRNARWPYTLSWTDTNSFNLTYVTHVNACTRVSDDEYNTYVN